MFENNTSFIRYLHLIRALLTMHIPLMFIFDEGVASWLPIDGVMAENYLFDWSVHFKFSPQFGL